MLASIYLNKNIAVYLASKPERCSNAISHLHQALMKLPQSSSSQVFSPDDAQRKVHDRQEPQECRSDDQYLSIQEGTEPSVNTPSYDEGIGAFSQQLFLQPSCTYTRRAIESTILLNLGLAYCSINEDHDAGLMHLEEALCVTQQIPSSSVGPCQFTILHNIGRLHFIAGRYTKTIKAYSHALTDGFSKTMEAFSKNESFRTTCTLNCIAVCRLYSRDEDTYPLGETLLILSQALGIHANVLRCADICKSTNRPMALAQATIINNIGRVLYQQEDFSGALSMYTKTSVLREALRGKDHIDVALPSTIWPMPIAVLRTILKRSVGMRSTSLLRACT
jgi:tetratricopeptide (TPR) repeat protein